MVDGTLPPEAPKGRGGIENLRPPSSPEEARELGRRGGIASGIARRRRISLREELLALLGAADGLVAKSIVAAMCHEAKRGNVGAFRAIAQVLGELKEVVGIETEELPPPFTIELHDAQYVAAERARTDAEFAGIADELAEAARPLPAPSADAGGNGGGSPANAETRQCDEKGACSPPRGGGYADTPAPPASDCAHVVTHESAWQPKRPLRPSEVEALKRAKREAERQAQPQTAAKPTGRYVALPAGFRKR